MEEWKSRVKERKRKGVREDGLQEVAQSRDVETLLHDNFYFGLFQGLDVREIIWLLGDEPLNSLFIYDHCRRTAERATWSIPWPVLFLLGYRHKKHRYLSKKVPDPRQVIDFVAEAIDKIKWRAHFAGTADSGQHRCLRYKKRVAHFTGLVSPEIAGLCYQIRSSIMTSLSASIAKARQSTKRKWANVLPIELAARHWLAVSQWCAVPTDKCGGFALISVEVLQEIQSELLAGPWYRVFGACCAEQTWRSLTPQYRRLSREIANVDDRVSEALLCGSLAEGHRRLPSTLIHTCKTHKDPGEVAFRAVHSSSRHSFMGIMCWISLVLKQALAKFPHLLESSDAFIDRISKVKMEENDVFLHMDLKDFFMTGSSQFLVHHASLIIPMRLRQVFRKALKFILDNQYITAHLFPQQWWRVVVGSGMGLKCSSDVSDAAFLHAIELSGLGLLSSRAAERFGIISYSRYRDNLLFVLKPDFEKIRSLKANIQSNIVPYAGTLEEASHIGITFLDLNIVKDHRWKSSGFVSFNPYFKPTSLIQVLSCSSAHKACVHESWMKAYVLRLYRHSSCLIWFRTMKSHFLYKLRKAGIDQALVTNIDRATKFTFPTKSTLYFGTDSRGGSDEENRKGGCIWVKLPFHPVWAECVSKGLRNLSSLPSVIEILQDLDPNCDGLRVAWCLKMPSLGGIVRKY
ncbi:MAG: hypothetical protein QGH82_03460 [Candidatus Woesearchaeota archaeon]|nr:hypothetical protein [Candidatus Woesearchaeota archaeon]